jgi:hypothetical protein
MRQDFEGGIHWDELAETCSDRSIKAVVLCAGLHVLFLITQVI